MPALVEPLCKNSAAVHDPGMNPIRKLIQWLRPKPADPALTATAEDARYEQETIKTEAVDGPSSTRGFKWPT
jgi:hypothetical protein